MKRIGWKSLISFGLLLLIVAGCSPAGSASESTVPDEELVEAGKLTIATTGNSGQQTFIGDDGELQGSDIDLCGAIAGELGLEANWVIVEWAGALPGLTTGNFDMVCSGVFRTDERLASPDLELADPVLVNGQGLVVRTGDDRINDWDDIAGLTMGVVRGSSSAQAVLDNITEDLEVVEFPGNTEGFLGLKNEVSDFFVTNYLISAAATKDDADIKLVGDVMDLITVGPAVKPNAPTLLAEVNAAIATFTEDGQLAGWNTKWFGDPLLP